MHDAIVIGAGLPGLMAAWRLAAGGLKVAVFERRTLAGESSGLAAGHVPQSAYTRPNLELLRRTRALVETLDRETGGVVRFNRVGGLSVTSSDENARLFERRVGELEDWGAATELLGPDEIKRRWPQFFVDDVKLGQFSPEDGFVRSLDLSIVLAARVRLAGAAIHEGCPVERIDVSDGSVSGVVVAGELVPARQVLLAAGGWSLPLARASGFPIPLRPFTLAVSMLVGVDFGLPFFNDVEGAFYTISRTPGTLLLGMPPVVEDISAESFPREPVPAQRARFLELLRRRVPALEDARVAGGWAGLLVSTPDGFPLLGEHPSIERLHVATGFGGGGLQRVTAAEAVAQSILGEAPFCDVTDYHVRRFAGYDGSDFDFADGLPYYYSDAASGPRRGVTTTSVGEPSR